MDEGNHMCALPPYPAAIRGTCAGEHNDVVVSHNGMDILRNTCSEEGNDADAEDSDMADFRIRVENVTLSRDGAVFVIAICAGMQGNAPDGHRSWPRNPGISTSPVRSRQNSVSR